MVGLTGEQILRPDFSSSTTTATNNREGSTERAMQSNGVIENGSSTGEIAVNGLVSNNMVSGKKRENGVCDGMEVKGVARRVSGEVLARRTKPRQQLSAKDLDIIRLIGQHLREMGFG